MGPTPDDEEAREFVEEIVDAAGCGANQGDIKAFCDVIRVELLPLPAASKFNILGLHGDHAADHFEQVALGFSAGQGPFLQARTHQGRYKNGETHQDGNHGQGNEGELPAVDQHDNHVDQGKDSIENRGEGGAGEEGAHLFHFPNPAAHFTHGPAIEVAQRQPEQVVHDFGAEAEVEAVGGVVEQEGAQAEQQAFKYGEDHQQQPEDAEGIGTGVDDCLVNHLLN